VLSDHPPHVIRWDTGLKPELLTALGNLAVVTAEVEELLHKIYWKHAGLNEKSGPIVTDNLNPKRLMEDILKIAGLDKIKANILADLKILFAEFETLNTQRNHCLHWIWEKVEQDSKGINLVPYSVGPVQLPPPYRVKKPVYRQSGIASESFDVNDIQSMCANCSWLSVRLRSHAMSEEELRMNRSTVGDFGAVVNADGSTAVSFADLFWPAPWLDKPLPPDSTPSGHRGTQK
jgi:hypothetical protein